MNHRILFLIAGLSLGMALTGCGAAQPTPDAAATEAVIAAKIFATLTASAPATAPQATATPVPPTMPPPSATVAPSPTTVPPSSTPISAAADFHPYSAAFPNGYPERAISHCAVGEPERARRTGHGTCGGRNGQAKQQSAGHRPQHRWLVAGSHPAGWTQRLDRGLPGSTEYAR